MRKWRCVGSHTQAGPTEIRSGYTTRRILEHSLVVEADSAEAAGDEFERLTGVIPDLVGNRKVVDRCEGCERLVFTVEAWYPDRTLTRVHCSACGPVPVIPGLETALALAPGSAGEGVDRGT